MPRAPAPLWARRKEPIMDSYIQAAIDQAGGKYDPETGLYATLVYAGIETPERAKEVSAALYRCAYYMATHKGPHVSMHTRTRLADDGTYSIEYSVYNKAHARAHIVNKYGSDRSKWAYDPRAKGR